MKNYILLFTLLLIAQLSCAQDAHFTNNRTASYLFNPSYTGNFLGNQKIQSTFRSQYQSIYTQAIVSAEMNISSPLNKAHWIGVGVNVGYDKMGSLDLLGTNLGARLAYHIGIGDKRKTVIRVGGGYDFFNIVINTDNYRSEKTILGQSDPDLKALNLFNPNFYSLHFGLGFTKSIGTKNSINMGLGIAHLNQPKFNAISPTEKPFFGRRTNINASWIHQLNKSLELEPAVYLSFSENQSNINTQMMTAWVLKPEQKWRAIAGVTYRHDESIGLVIGYRDAHLYVTLSTDILVTQTLNHINNPGALELGAYYIIHSDRAPKIKPILLCPSL